MMLSKLAHIALALSYATHCFAQTAKVPQDRFANQIPKTESLALAQIVEDDPASAPAARGGGSSTPSYTLYSVALPIPPLAQVKQ